MRSSPRLLLTILLAAAGCSDAFAAVDGCGSAPTVANGGFETGSLASWTASGHVAVVRRTVAHSGMWGARVGRPLDLPGHHSLAQHLHVPEAAAGRSTLSFWIQPHCLAAPDRVRVEIRDPAGQTLATVLNACAESSVWEQRTFDLSAFAGQPVTLWFGADHERRRVRGAYLLLDDVQVLTEVAAPSVSIIEPTDGATVRGIVTISATATASRCAALERIELFADATLLGTSITSPASALWDTSTAASGEHTLSATAFDTLGNESTASVTVHIAAPICSNPNHLWRLTFPVDASVPSEPITAVTAPYLTDVGDARTALVYPIGNTIHSRDPDNLRGSWLSLAGGARIPSRVVAVQVVDPSFSGQLITYVFWVASNGRLYRGSLVDAGLLQPQLSPLWSIDLRRGLGCIPDDTLVATPTIQLQSESNADFLLGTDAIYVITHHGCGDFSQNQVIALDLYNLTVLWRFNQYGEYQMNFSDAGCTLDRTLNRLYCGTHQWSGEDKKTLWAINVNDGSLAWAKNLGSVDSRPVLNTVSRHLFVGGQAAGGGPVLYALDPDHPTDPGHVDWSLPVGSVSDGAITKELWAESRAPLADMVFGVIAGSVFAVVDGGIIPGEGFELWRVTPSHAMQITSEPVISNDLKLYVGRRDGALVQLAPPSGTEEAIRAIGPPGAIGITAIGATSGATLLPNAVIASASAYDAAGETIFTKRFCAPFVDAFGE